MVTTQGNSSPFALWFSRFPVKRTVIEPLDSKTRPHVIENNCRDCETLAWFTRLPDTILNRTVPIEIILEVHEMLLELEETIMHVVLMKYMKILTQKMAKRTRNLIIALMKGILLLSNFPLQFYFLIREYFLQKKCLIYVKYCIFEKKKYRRRAPITVLFLKFKKRQNLKYPVMGADAFWRDSRVHFYLTVKYIYKYRHNKSLHLYHKHRGF